MDDFKHAHRELQRHFRGNYSFSEGITVFSEGRITVFSPRGFFYIGARNVLPDVTRELQHKFSSEKNRLLRDIIRTTQALK
jgi:exonuclease VII large subunit